MRRPAQDSLTRPADYRTAAPPPFAGGPFLSYVTPVIPELTSRVYAPVTPDAPFVVVAPGVLRLAALSLAGGAAALCAAANGPALAASFNSQSFIVAPLLFAAVAAALPVQLLAVTRPLVKEVLTQSLAPARVRLIAALAVSSGSVLTAVAWWSAFQGMCAVGA
jgi:hypothetical protein